MDLLIELVPYIGGIFGILVVTLLAKWGISVNKQVTIGTSITVIQKLLEIFNGVELADERTGVKGDGKLDIAVNIAKNTLNRRELDIVANIGKVAEKRPDKPTFGDNIKAGVQDIFINSVSMLAKDKIGRLIKKI